MSNDERAAVTALNESLESVVGYDSPNIYSRDAWGSQLTFESYREDFERVFEIARIFSNLPYTLLPDRNLAEIKNAVDAATAQFQKISNINVTTANNPQNTFTALGDGVKTQADALTTAMAQWISYLAYEKGDVSKNIEKLRSAIDNAETMLGEAEGRITQKENDINKIVQQAQDFAGDKGVTVFTEQFNNAAGANAKEANRWLSATIVISIIAVLFIGYFVFGDDSAITPFKWVSRAALVGLLITASLWCGGTYRILRHQQSVNAHKANGLKSFLLFRDAADNDETTRNAVLLETTKSIFSTPSSGFVHDHGKGSDHEIRVVGASVPLSTVSSAAKAAVKSSSDQG